LADSWELTDDENLLIPYESLEPAYLRKPVYIVRVTTMTSEETYNVLLPYPDIEVEVADISTRTNSDRVQLESIAVDMTVDSEKPTQLVNLHTDFGTTESYDYGPEIKPNDFETIDGAGTTRLARDFAESPESVYERHFRERFPIERDRFSVIVGQVAPLARTTFMRASVID